MGNDESQNPNQKSNIKNQISKIIFNEKQISETIERLAREILQHVGNRSITFIGIKSRGVPLAERLASICVGGQSTTLQNNLAPQLPGVAMLQPVPHRIGKLDITLYRDDFSQLADWPLVGESDIPLWTGQARLGSSGDIANAIVVLVDDVLYTGRTIRAAINALMDYGRPQAILLVVLVDRGLRELPIQPDFVGLKISTTASDHVRVHLKEIDGADEVVVERHD